MNIYEFAMQMEKDGEDYYRSLAGKCGNKGLANILSMLAETEVEHFNTLKKMAGGIATEHASSDLFTGVKNIFSHMQEEGQPLDLNISHIELYKKAQELEKISEDFYREKAETVEDSIHKRIFNQMADEEKKHFVVLEHLIEFVSAPSNWLENAEWNQLEDF